MARSILINDIPNDMFKTANKAACRKPCHRGETNSHTDINVAEMSVPWLFSKPEFLHMSGAGAAAAAAAKSLQSCLTIRPHRRQPTRLPCPWDSPGKNTGVGCHFLLQCMNVKSESEVTQSCPTLSNPVDYSPPGSSVHGICQARVLEWVAIAFSSQVQWSSKKILPKYVPTIKPCNSNFSQISTEWGPKDVFPKLWSGATKGRHL